MRRPVVFSYLIIPILAVTFAIAWVAYSSPTQETLPERMMRLAEHESPAVHGSPAQHERPVSTISMPESGVRFVHHGPNHPPVVNSPVDVDSRVVLFPAGPGTDLEFVGDPASDYEEDILTYRFGIAIPGKLGIRSPEEALLCVDRYGSRFYIRPRSFVTPAEFANVYGNVGTVPVLPAVIYASDGKSESKPVIFNLTVVYDASTGNSSPAESMGERPGRSTLPADRFERASDSMAEAYTLLEKVAGESRVWRLDPPSFHPGTDRAIGSTN